MTKIKKVVFRPQETLTVETVRGYVLINGKSAFHKESGRVLISFLTQCSNHELVIALREGLDIAKPIAWMHNINHPNLEIPSPEFNTSIVNCLRRSGLVLTLYRFVMMGEFVSRGYALESLQVAGKIWANRQCKSRAIPEVIEKYTQPAQEQWFDGVLPLLDEYRDKHKLLKTRLANQDDSIQKFKKRLRDIIVIDTTYVFLLGAVLYGIIWG